MKEAEAEMYEDVDICMDGEGLCADMRDMTGKLGKCDRESTLVKALQ